MMGSKAPPPTVRCESVASSLIAMMADSEEEGATDRWPRVMGILLGLDQAAQGHFAPRRRDVVRFGCLSFTFPRFISALFSPSAARATEFHLQSRRRELLASFRPLVHHLLNVPPLQRTRDREEGVPRGEGRDLGLTVSYSEAQPWKAASLARFTCCHASQGCSRACCVDLSKPQQCEILLNVD